MALIPSPWDAPAAEAGLPAVPSSAGPGFSMDADVVIVGAGFSGLAAAYELCRRGLRPLVLEAGDSPGGLAGTFTFSDGVELEKFYHHWFSSDVHIQDLIRELGAEGQVLTLPSRTGMYLNRRHWKFASPRDLLAMTALPVWDRLRLGFSVLEARRQKDWRRLEEMNVREWLEPRCGSKAFRTIWEPLLRAKFGSLADEVNAAWMWKKLALRGATRNKCGHEELLYFSGGFGALARRLAAEVEKLGGRILLRTGVLGAEGGRDRLTGLQTRGGVFRGRHYLFTPALPVIAEILEGVADAGYLHSLRRVRYLGNICLVLRLRRSLSGTYWLNVNDPGFPFVGVIEHTNLHGPSSYGDSHMVYLSRYLPPEDPAWDLSDQERLAEAVPHLQRMFPEFDPAWILDHCTWSTPHAQPVTERGYSRYLPGSQMPFENASLCTMAQVYPEDRGTNYAVREGRKVAAKIAERCAA